MLSKRTLILHWLAQGAIKPGQGKAALSCAAVLPDSRRWITFIQNLLAWLGALALAFAVMFFIAFNWEAMGRFAKFGLIEVFIILSLLVYWRLDSDKLSGKLSLLVTSLLLGVLLAFYGQTYQTGADPWQLFANWALLILPWVIISRFAVQWLLWVSLLNLAIVLYFKVRPGVLGIMFDSTADTFWQLFIFNSLAWCCWEYWSKRFIWLAERWTVRLIALASGSAITLLCLHAIFDDYDAAALVVLAYAAWLGAVYFVYLKRIPDLFMLAGLCLSVIVVITSLLSRLLLEAGDPVGGFLLLAILITAMTAGATIWLKNIHRAFQS